MRKDTLKTFEKTLLYSKKKVILPANQDRKHNNSDKANNRTDQNITDMLPKFTGGISVTHDLQSSPKVSMRYYSRKSPNKA